VSRAEVIIRHPADRTLVSSWATQVPIGTRVLFKATKRSIPQNDRMWAMLTDIARQVSWHGQKLTPDDWKLIFLDGLKREERLVPSIEGNGFVDLGRASSDLSKEEMSNLIDLMSAFGANHGVVFGDTPDDR